MMKKYLLTFIIGICSAVTSCKKEKINIIPTSLDYLSGTWRMTHFAFDINNNGSMDTFEKYVPLYLMDYTFYPNGKGNIYSIHPTVPDDSFNQSFDWSFQNNNKQIAMTEKILQKTKIQYANVNQLDSKYMILEIRDTSYESMQIDWLFFEKKK